MAALTRVNKIGRKYLNPVPTEVAGPSLMFKVLRLYLSNKEERVPRLPLGPFRTNPRIYDHPPASGLRVTWLGHSSLLLEIDGVRLLLDPVWDERASPFSWMGPKRFYPSPLSLSDLPAIDVVLVSHDHYDHLGKQTIRNLSRLEATRKARWVTSLDVGKELIRFGVPAGQITELDWTQSLNVLSEQNGASISITALPARHFSGRSVWNRFETLWSSFVLKGKQHNVYFGADSGMWDGFTEIGRVYGPFDLIMLEVGAYNELWRSIHMGPDGAAQAFALLEGSAAAGLLMPVHWGLFNLALHAWRHPIERLIQLADTAGIKLWSPEPGLPTEVIAGREHRSSWWSPAPGRRLKPKLVDA
jgi:L-ascorbate metabolism protein UlaG (beta-lactamase superfamily)